MGYNGHIYQEDEYVDVISSKEVERLLGYGVITVGMLPATATPDVEPESGKKITEQPKVADTSVVKGKRRSKKK